MIYICINKGIICKGLHHLHIILTKLKNLSGILLLAQIQIIQKAIIKYKN